MYGNGGNDTYYVDNKDDVASENLPTDGYDTVKSTAASYTLGKFIEVLEYIGPGTANFVGTGNALDNVIIGGGGDDTLDGGLGADTMYGGDGNDVYKVDSDGDRVVEGGFDLSGKFIDFGGSDEIQTTKSLCLLPTENGANGNIEKLTYVGTDKFIGTGNGLANLITGGVNADTLDGAGGNDTLTGGGGADTFHFGNHWGSDKITDFEVGKDVIDLRDVTGLNMLSQLNPTDTAQGLLLTFDTGSSITLNGIQKSQLVPSVVSSMFLFTPPKEIVGTTKPESLIGTVGVDHISGLGGNDILIGLGGPDVLDGGANTDTASYATSSAGVTVNLTTGTGHGGDAEGDTLISIEHVLGSAFADNLTGTKGVDILEGGAGNDVLDGGGGADKLLGGTGNDMIWYHDGVKVDGVKASITSSPTPARLPAAFTSGCSVPTSNGSTATRATRCRCKRRC
jgi:serralysin